MNILITGCAGFIGSHLTERLLSLGHAVIGIDIINNLYPTEYKLFNLRNVLKQKAFMFVQEDICKTETGNIIAYFDKKEKIDSIVHLAAYPGVRPSFEMPQAYVDNNIDGTLSILQLAKHFRSGVLFASSSSVYGNTPANKFTEGLAAEPISVYGATKVAGEALCRSFFHAYKIPVTCLRFFTCYGPRQRPDLAIYKFVKAAYAGEPITLFGDGRTMRDYTFIDDIVDGIVKAITQQVQDSSAFRIYNLGSSEPILLSHLVDLIEQLTDRPIQRVWQELVKGDVDKTWAENSLARLQLGWAPKTKLPQGLAQFIAWFKENRLER